MLSLLWLSLLLLLFFVVFFCLRLLLLVLLFSNIDLINVLYLLFVVPVIFFRFFEQLHRNYADLYSSLLCRYHETLEVTKLLPEDAKLAITYDETALTYAFPVHKYGKVDRRAKGAVQVKRWN